MLAGMALTVHATTPDMIEKEVTVSASVAEVWRCWTTEEGLSFVSAKSRVGLRIGGPYEWFLDLDPDDQGRRGSEGSQVLAFLPEKMLAFAWTFPPDVPELRYAGATTQVVVLLDDAGDGRTRVRLFVHGWQDGEPWERGRKYFDSAWSYVLTAMKSHLEAR